MLKLDDLSKHFDGVRAVDGLSLEVDQGEVFGLIGPNGSGKSTTVNLICGVLSATRGKVTFKGRDLHGLPPHRRLNAGISRTFQNIRLFGELTVWQNVWIARRDAPGREAGFIRNWFGSSARTREAIEETLVFADLAGRANDLAQNLAFGEQRRLELARAVAARPDLILLDEPAAGMNREEVEDLRQRILALKHDGITVLLVEHVMELVMGVTDRIAVLNFGKLIALGTPGEIQGNAAVREAYLGSPDSESA
ncbi:MAG: ABC transporter ATP-binding protein [Paracoccaceae bacterium]|nr:ABC transporter ATP-binding protein [Paracoccaceae bacterium]MDE2913776.1 ABC transporter ATP-binding protein [Paracoccaceae bacterium]